MQRLFQTTFVNRVDQPLRPLRFHRVHPQAVLERGAAVFNNWCSACHSHGPQNAPGTSSLQFKYQGSLPAALEDRTDLTADQVKFYVRNGVAMMAPFRKTEVGDGDLEALAAYLTRRR